MVANRGHSVVYLPQSRHYGLDCVEQGDEFFVVGRVYIQMSEPDANRSFAVRPYEGGPVGHDTVDFYPRLTELPPVTGNFALAQLVEVRELVAGRRDFFLDLTRRDWSEYNPLCRIPQESLALKGLVAGRTYPIEWVIPQFALRLDGVDGVYYAGVFHESSSGSYRGLAT